LIPIRTALLSAYHKDGLDDLAAALVETGARLLSTGGTYAWLRERGFGVLALEEWAGLPSLFGGRVKTLHPRVHGGILYRRGDPGDEEQRGAHGIEPIDLVVIDLYPFEETSASASAAREAVVEMIDIGGPAMLRSAAKNHRSVAAVCDPGDYVTVAAALRAGGGSLTEEVAARLAAKVFRRTARYDAAIAAYLESAEGRGGDLPDAFTRGGALLWKLRYGENPSQRGAFYGPASGFPGGLRKVQGKEVSFNNLQDLEAAVDLVRAFSSTPAAVVIKHATPCGAATGIDLLTAYRAARDADSLSAFGGVVALNDAVDGPCAEELTRTFLELVAAPSFTPEARGTLAAKKNLILLEGEALLPSSANTGEARYGFKGLGNGILLQDPVPDSLGESRWRVVSRRPPTPAEERSLLFAWRVVRAVRSNGIVLARDGRVLGIGGGQTSRIDSLWIAIHKARREGHDLQGSVMASDAFFPFPDCVEEAAKVGVSAIIQPGGSKRDGESVEAADRSGMAMVLNDARCFRHG
jgi:phosphoribosylaminoimidazolecarboxamide formyltransferase / IMP cyclohydrolase